MNNIQPVNNSQEKLTIDELKNVKLVLEFYGRLYRETMKLDNSYSDCLASKIERMIEQQTHRNRTITYTDLSGTMKVTLPY